MQEVLSVKVLKEIRFVNIGVDPFDNREPDRWIGRRQWAACTKYKFLSAGQGEIYNLPLLNINKEDVICAYASGRGYVGIGIVSDKVCGIDKFKFADYSISDLSIEEAYIKDKIRDDATVKQLPEIRKTLFANAYNKKKEFVVSIDWKRTVTLENFKWVRGERLFFYRNIQCVMSDKLNTLTFLQKEFNIQFS